MKTLRFLGVLVAFFGLSFGAAHAVGCDYNEYGDLSDSSCTPCPTSYPYSLDDYNTYQGQCFKKCSDLCTQYDWTDFFPENADRTVTLFDTTTPSYQIEFKMLAGDICGSTQNRYCAYRVMCAGSGTGGTQAYACKPGHKTVTFKDQNNTTLGTLWVVHQSVWSAYQTNNDESYSNVFYPVFKTPDAPTVSNKKFIGWYDSATGGNLVIGPASNGVSYGTLNFANANGITADTILYAHYEDVYTVQVQCSATSSPLPLNTYSAGDTFTINDIEADAAKYCPSMCDNGETQNGWDVLYGTPAINWGTSPVDQNATITIGSDPNATTITIMPHCESVVNTYTATYSCGDGATGTPPASDTVPYGTKPTLPSSTNTCAKTGYTLSGWRVDGESTDWNNGTSVWNYSANKSLTAQWRANEYTATYSCGDGATGTPPTSDTVSYGTKPTLPSTQGTCKKTGYTLSGWRVDGESTNWNNGTSVWNYSANKSLAAQWRANEYTATFDCSTYSGGGSTPVFVNPETGLEPMTGIHIGDTVTLPSTSLCIPNPNIPECGRTGAYTPRPRNFWEYNNQRWSGTIEWPGATNITFYINGASYSNTTVFYNCGGVGGTAPTSQTVNYRNCASEVIAEPTDCTPGTGIEFQGWKRNSGTGDIIAPGQVIGSWGYEGIVNLVAQWECTADGYTYDSATGTCVANTYTATYSCGDGATGTAPNDDTVTYGTKPTLPSSTNTCAKTGYTLSGWRVDGESADWDNGTSVWNYSANKSLTAQWRANEYTASFNCSFATGMMNSPAGLEDITGIHLGDTITLPSTSLCIPNPAVVPECGMYGTYAVSVGGLWSRPTNGMTGTLIQVPNEPFVWPLASNIRFVLQGFSALGTTVKYDCGAVGGTAPANQYVNYLNCDRAELSEPTGCTPGAGIEFTGWKYNGNGIIYQPGQIIGELWDAGSPRQMTAQWRCTEPGQVFNQQTGTCDYIVQYKCNNQYTPLGTYAPGSVYTVSDDLSNYCTCNTGYALNGFNVLLGSDEQPATSNSPVYNGDEILIGSTYGTATPIILTPNCVPQHSVKYLCYAGDTTGQTDSFITNLYTVRGIDFITNPQNCGIANNDFHDWFFSGDGNVHGQASTIQWNYDNNQTFVPAYTATFECEPSTYLQPTSAHNSNAIVAKLGAQFSIPSMTCEPKPEFEGWISLDSQWNYTYESNMSTPVPGATCGAGDFYTNAGGTFNWNCPTDLTFTPKFEFTTKNITVSCGVGGTTGEIELTYGTQNQASTLVANWLAQHCTGSCQNPSGSSHGYWKFCGVWENGAVPNVVPITGEPGCYKAETAYNLNQINWVNVSDFNITTVAHCPKYVNYKCSADATDVYNEPPYSYFEEEYVVLDNATVGCTDSGHAFSNWKVENQNVYYDENQPVAEWPYENEVTLVAQWGGANTYHIYYQNMENAEPSNAGMPNTYTFGIGATINGVPTRPLSEFLGWCTDSVLTDCDTTQVISTTDVGDKTFWAKWECMTPYHQDPNDPSQCVSCPDNTWWNPATQTCDSCKNPFPYSRAPYNWSERQCYRPCPDNSQCQSNIGNMLSGIPSSCNVELFPSGITTQIEFKGNSDDGIQTCGGAVPNCPYGFTTCGMATAYKPMVAPVEFHGKIPEQDLGTRYIFGKRAGAGSIDLTTGVAWSQIAGSGQKSDVIHNNVDGVMIDYYYTHILYPTDIAPDATVPGYTFHGYYYPRTGGTRYVESNYLLDATNAQSILDGQTGNSNTARHLYATLENGGYTQNEYTITYDCGNSTGTTQTDTATYGEDYTVKHNVGYTNCENPGYSFLGWTFSSDGNTYDEGYVFRPWNHTNDATFIAKWSNTGNAYNITYKPNYTGATQSDVGQPVTYGESFTTKPAGTFTRPGYEMSGWSGPFPMMNTQYTYNIVGNTTLNAQWQMCVAGTYAGENETQCTNCPPEYPLSQGGATTITECYKNCSVPCTPVVCPDNSTCTQSNTTYSGTEYYGGTCDAEAQNCDILTVTCDANYYLDDTICEPCPNGTTSPAGSTSSEQCVPVLCGDGQYLNNITCENCPNGYPHSDLNATSQSQCYYNCETPCTEPGCPENAISCTYGTNPNPGAWYYGTNACNSESLICPITSVTCANGYGFNSTNNTCEPCAENEVSVNNSCEPCPDGTQPNETGTECEPCPEGEYGLGGICNPCPAGTQPNTDHTACEPCPDGQYSVNGVCVPCPAGTYGTDGTCEPCGENYSSAPGSTSIDDCFLTNCSENGYHLNHGQCDPDEIECDAPYATIAIRTWDATLGAYGSCQIVECDEGYHIASNACVPNDGLCTVANGRGERVWNGNTWGACENVECDPGFVSNLAGIACERCSNYIGSDGQPAVSSYITGCEIASCMYQGQKYALEGDECTPICEDAADDTGSKYWNETTHKCVRTCNPGYKMW